MTVSNKLTIVKQTTNLEDIVSKSHLGISYPSSDGRGEMRKNISNLIIQALLEDVNPILTSVSSFEQEISPNPSVGLVLKFDVWNHPGIDPDAGLVPIFSSGIVVKSLNGFLFNDDDTGEQVIDKLISEGKRIITDNGYLKSLYALNVVVEYIKEGDLERAAEMCHKIYSTFADDDTNGDGAIEPTLISRIVDANSKVKPGDEANNDPENSYVALNSKYRGEKVIVPLNETLGFMRATSNSIMKESLISSLSDADVLFKLANSLADAGTLSPLRAVSSKSSYLNQIMADSSDKRFNLIEDGLDKYRSAISAAAEEATKDSFKTKLQKVAEENAI